jgi:Flp pilus assembly protein TadB
MSHSLGSLALILVVAIILFAYSAGFSEGKTEGQGEGHARGKKEGAVRAFAVGYDRGKRERDDDDEDEEESAPSQDGASIVMFLVLALGTFIMLLVVQSMRQQGG